MHDSALIVGLLGITAALTWGVSDFFSARSAKTVGPIMAACLINVLGVVLFALIYAVFFRSHTHITAIGLSYTLISGVFLSLGAASFFVGLGEGPVSIVSPLTSTYPLVTTLLAVAVYHAHLNNRQSVGIMLTIFGILAASGLLSLHKSERRLGKGPLYALTAAVLWGIGFVLLAQALKHMDWQITSLINFATTPLTFFVLVPFIKGDEVISRASMWQGLHNKFVIGAGLIQLIGVVALDIGISKSTNSSGAVVTAISACYPILTIFLALRHFKEKVKPIPLLGALTGIIGIIVLSLD